MRFFCFRLPPLALALACLFACGSGTRVAPTGPHPPHVQEFVLVDYPPPPAVVEEIPQAHAPGCVWVDGHYVWEDRRYVWRAGQWVVAVPGCYYAPPVVAWSRGGEPRLYYTPPRWYIEDALTRSADKAVCPAAKPCPR